ncbi:hypothetical protein JOC85_002688 [Bacillus mesophilus]|uniref:Uncharacterized protein n=1 Tax=Bacillus mesophilus TaxID=1808955 RepID=A0A6M0Q942_9BACI|nr:hypothetical protein [Bacillus mesophilus]MBM7661881.1 hypothetical protein [Bacillus mesophilus]NEY72757.1 hypothetical protein [Bacillus mesophilus]
MKNKKPKFKVGDIVVISLFGTVCKVSKVRTLDGMYVYELSNKEGIYLEDTLTSIREYDESVPKNETLQIEFKYFFGDLVQVIGYEQEIFKIVGLRTEIWRYKKDAWEDITYELSRLSDGEWLEASEEEIILIADHVEAPVFLQKLEVLYSKSKETKVMELLQAMNLQRKTEKELLRLKRERKAIIDGLLDVYNDYKTLYELFEEEEYKNVMDLVMDNLIKFTTGKADE